MLPKKEYRLLAEKMRHQGKTYSEISKSIPVSRSSLSLWLRAIALSADKQSRIETIRVAGQKAGAQARHKNRLDRQNELKTTIQKDISNLTKDPFFTFGLSLYWAEGSKQKPWRITGNVGFTNSDPQAILIMRSWLNKFADISPENITYRLHIHKSANIEKSIEEWASILGVDKQAISLSIKKPSTKNGRCFNPNYKGLIHMRIRKSTWLNRKISLWSEFVAEKFLADTI